MKAALLLFLLSAPVVCAGSTFLSGDQPSQVEESFDPAGDWTFDYETAVLVRASDNTFQNYTVVPQIISLRTPAHVRIDLGDFGELTMRSRLSLLVEPILKGPENLYLGWSGSPSIEYWAPSKKWNLYTSVGGGFGWIDSQDVPGGQGQDFTFNWFAAAGFRYYVRPAFSVNLGVMFQHWSNRGQTDPNPGLDALGPSIGVSWSF